MFSKIWKSLRKSLYDSDDTRFSQDISTAEGRLKKLQTLQDSRLNSLYLFLTSNFLLLVQMLQSFGAKNTDVSGFITFAFPLYLMILSSVTYLSFDSQIKMLLLFEKTQPKE